MFRAMYVLAFEHAIQNERKMEKMEKTAVFRKMLIQSNGTKKMNLFMEFACEKQAWKQAKESSNCITNLQLSYVNFLGLPMILSARKNSTILFFG